MLAETRDLKSHRRKLGTFMKSFPDVTEIEPINQSSFLFVLKSYLCSTGIFPIVELYKSVKFQAINEVNGG